jgi:hypothetical protein
MSALSVFDWIETIVTALLIGKKVFHLSSSHINRSQLCIYLFSQEDSNYLLIKLSPTTSNSTSKQSAQVAVTNDDNSNLNGGGGGDDEKNMKKEKSKNSKKSESDSTKSSNKKKQKKSKKKQKKTSIKNDKEQVVTSNLASGEYGLLIQSKKVEDLCKSLKMSFRDVAFLRSKFDVEDVHKTNEITLVEYIYIYIYIYMYIYYILHKN